MVAFVACGGTAAGSPRFMDCESCVEAVQRGVEPGECADGCVGCGDCAASCGKGAISLADGRILIDRDKCDGCGDCAAPEVCPRKLIRMIPADATHFIPCSSTEENEDAPLALCGSGCIGCGDCEKVCPADAVHLVERHAVIDYDKCVGCAACVTACRKRIILDLFHSVEKLKSRVAFVRCNGDGKTAALLRHMDVGSCRQAAELDLKDGSLCASGCLGLGDCTVACQNDAISVKNGVSQVDARWCVGCGDCVRACPRGLITLVPYQGQKLVACHAQAPRDDAAEGCDLCGICARNCPADAIRRVDGHMEIDPARCENCRICAELCPKNVIHPLEVPAAVERQQRAFRIGKEMQA